MALVAASIQETSTSHLYTQVQIVEQKVCRKLSNENTLVRLQKQTQLPVTKTVIVQEVTSTQKWQCGGKIPLPSLEATLSTYLKDLEAIEYDEEKLQSTRGAAQRFLDTNGPLIQKALCVYAEENECWPHDMWLQEMYFRVPLPLMVNSNPGMIFPPLSVESEEHWVRIAARTIAAMLEFKAEIDNELLQQDVSRTGSLLCMEQYRNVFTCYRRAGIEVDERVFTPPELAHHIVVAYKGQFAKLQVLVEDVGSDVNQKLGSKPLRNRTLDELWMDLQNIIRLVDHHEDEKQPEVGLFTAQDRRVWGKIRQQLLAVDEEEEESDETKTKENCNFHSLRCLEHSLFVLCLDDDFDKACDQTADNEESECDAPRTEHMLRMIHGQGPAMHTKNRWFEKSCQLILPRDGKWGLNYEHSTAEGMPLVRMAEYVVKRVLDNEQNNKTVAQSTFRGEARFLDESDCLTTKMQLRNSILTPPPELPTFELLKFRFGDKRSSAAENVLSLALEEAKLATQNLVEATDVRVFTFRDFGKNIPKLCRASPDCFIQLALQLAHYRCHQKLVATYESASIRAFHRGRVDVIRSATREAYDWVRVMDEDEFQKPEKVSALRTALKRQTEQMKLANSGHGIDNHLMALREFSSKEAKLPEIFTDESFKNFMTFGLSTSQVPTSMPNCCMGYGAVVPHGYGCSYNIHEDSIIFVVSSFRTCETTDTVKYYRAVAQALRDMKLLLLTE